MDAALLIEKIIQLGDVGLHLRELHAGVGVEYAVNGQALLDHQQQKTRTVFSAGEGDRRKGFAVIYSSHVGRTAFLRSFPSVYSS